MDPFSRLPVPRLRPRSRWRNTSSFSPEEIRRTERWLATARVFLAISALVAVWIDPGEIRSVWAYGLLAFYIGQGTAIIFLLRSRRQSTASFRMLVHAADVVWPALISLCTTSQSNPFFLFFFFVIAAAAYRWGLWETVMTSLSSVSLLWLEGLAIRLGAIDSLNLWLVRHRLPQLSPDDSIFQPRHLFIRSVYLVVMGLLLGYLAEQQKKLRAEKDEASRLLAAVSLEAGLAGTLSQIVGELLRLYSSPRGLIASRELRSQKVSVGEVELHSGIAQLHWLDPGTSGADTYLGENAAAACYAQTLSRRDRHYLGALSLNSDGVVVRELDPAFFTQFAKVHPFRRAIAISFSFGPELGGRMFLLDPEIRSGAEEELRFLHDLVRQVGPAIYNVYLLRRLRRRAGALERARLVRELHDGAVQSLIGVEMQVDVLRKQYAVGQALGDELDRIQLLLREEVLNLRELMQQMQASDIDSRRLRGFLRDTVQRFQRETGIKAHFIMDDLDVVLPQPVCRELARIVQEALVNVRKHSQAKQVLVELLEAHGQWDLIIEDDGAGFPFSGRITQAELDAAGQAPAIIRERVRLIQAELTIESRPGRGSRLEIRLPETHQAAHG